MCACVEIIRKRVYSLTKRFSSQLLPPFDGTYSEEGSCCHSYTDEDSIFTIATLKKAAVAIATLKKAAVAIATLK